MEDSSGKCLPRSKKARELKWTTKSLEALSVKQRTDFTDPQTKGLTLRATPNGTKTWAMLYRRKSDGDKRRVNIGSFPEVGLSKAREEAAKLRVLVNARKDPAGEVEALKKAETVNELLDEFLKRHPRPDAEWTLACARHFKKDVRPLIGSIKLPELTRQNVRSVLNAVKDRGAKATVNRTLAAMRRAFSWAVSQDIMDANPALNMATDIAETPKDRALSVDEIKAFWKGLDDPQTPMGDKSRIALKVILATGQRPGEVCGATRAEVDLNAKTWTISSARAKNRRVHVVPLSSMAIDLFNEAIELSVEDKSFFIFTSRPRKGLGLDRTTAMQAHALSHAMRGALDHLGLMDNPATPHDLRRTAATHLARLGMSDRVVGRVLNHGTELRRTITARVYIQHDFAVEKKLALDAWASELRRIVTGQSGVSNVVELKVVSDG
jgi:integrase